jgi:S1-C subfamily serine protease
MCVAVTTSKLASPKDENAMTASVGFVIVGVQALVPSGRTLHLAFSTGSCFAVTSTGFLLTNRHVVSDFEHFNDPDVRHDVERQTNAQIEPHIWVFFGNNKFEASVFYVSENFDVAVLKIARPGQACFRLAAKTSEVRATEVFAAGFPGLGSEALGMKELRDELNASDAQSREFDIASQFKPRDFEYTLTNGIVSRIVPAADGQLWIQHEALIRHGNSGGPLMNNSGIVLGINTWMQHDKDGDVQTNMTLDIAQLRPELDAHISGLTWVSP